jgi:DNA-binding LacI/PurR family transcriptional regulator
LWLNHVLCNTFYGNRLALKDLPVLLPGQGNISISRSHGFGLMNPKSPKKRPTSQDVAKLAGVSVTTVSYVINERTGKNFRISEETRRKVWQAVEALNYRPLSAARILRTRRSNLLALMIPYIEAPYYPLLAVAVQHEAEKEGFRVLICDTRHRLQREEDFLDVLLSHSVDGIIIQSDQLSGDDIDSLVETDVAVVVLGNRPTHPSADNLMIDEIKAAEEAVAYLIDKGHTRVGSIGFPVGAGVLRKEGYMNALQTHGIPVDDELICELDLLGGQTGELGMKKLLALSEPPTAVFAARDPFAVDALLFAIDSGLSVPEDVAIVGFDDLPVASWVRPKLTTVHKDASLLGAIAVQLLVERITSNQPIPARQKIMQHKLVCRESA